MNYELLALCAAMEASREIMDIYSRPTEQWQVEQKADNSPLTLADRRAHRVIAARLRQSGLPVLSEEGAHAPYAQRRAWQELWVVDPLDGTKEFIKRNGEFTVNVALVRTGRPVLGVVVAPATGMCYVGSTLGASPRAVRFAVPPTDFPTEEARLLALLSEGEELPLHERRRGGRCVCVVSRSHLSAPTETFIESLRREPWSEVELHPSGSSLKICLVAEGTADVYPRLAPTMEWDTCAGHAVALAAGCRVQQHPGAEELLYNKEDLHNTWFVVRPL